MKRVTITDAKNNLSRHLQYVRRGGRVRILDRDTPVADLVPVEPAAGEDEDDDRLLASLVKRGIARAGEAGDPPRELYQPGPRCPGAVDVFLAERKQGR